MISLFIEEKEVLVESDEYEEYELVVNGNARDVGGDGGVEFEEKKGKTIVTGSVNGDIGVTKKLLIDGEIENVKGGVSVKTVNRNYNIQNILIGGGLLAILIGTIKAYA